MASASVQKPLDIYVRVSRTMGRDVSAEGGTAEQQEARCRAQLAADGLPAGQVFIDLDESGAKKSRPQFDRMLERIESGKSGGVVVLNLSRLTRANDVVERITWIEAQGARFISVEQKVDTSSPTGKLVLRVLDAINTMKVDEAREQWQGNVDNAIARGIYIGATPVGFSKDEKTQKLYQNADAPVVREVFLKRASGTSWDGLCKFLEAAGVKPVDLRTAERNIDAARQKLAKLEASVDKEAQLVAAREQVAKYERVLAAGGTWHINGVRSLIGNRVYKGILKNGHEHFVPEYAIVTQAEWDAAQPAKGAGNRQKGERGTWAILAGVIRCASCDTAMSPGATHKDGKVYKYYRCQSRTCTAKARVNAEKAEGQVAAWALEALKLWATTGGTTAGHDLDVEEQAVLEQAVADAKGRVRAALLALDPSDADDAAALETLQVEVEAAKQALAEYLGSQAVAITPDDWEANWSIWSVEERRTALRHVVRGVQVERGGAILVTLKDDLGDEEGNLRLR